MKWIEALDKVIELARQNEGYFNEVEEQAVAIMTALSCRAYSDEFVYPEDGWNSEADSIDLKFGRQMKNRSAKRGQDKS